MRDLLTGRPASARGPARQTGGRGLFRPRLDQEPGGREQRPQHQPAAVSRFTAPKYADLDKVNPGSVILSGEMMLRYLGWTEAADLVLKGMEGAIAAKLVTYDFARLMTGSKEVKCSEFGDAVIKGMDGKGRKQEAGGGRQKKAAPKKAAKKKPAKRKK